MCCCLTDLDYSTEHSGVCGSLMVDGDEVVEAYAAYRGLDTPDYRQSTAAVVVMCQPGQQVTISSSQ